MTEPESYTEKNTIVWMYEIATIKGWDGKSLALFQCAHCGTSKTVPANVVRLKTFPYKKIVNNGMEVCPKCRRAFDKSQKSI